ncbi:hypothetical protein [Lactiplantibacillus plantarum]|uniref:hypothetical protein n=1 Tax=Lactiplantibacillus plantarum TaxID=1590 RepID=UPI003F539A0F
MIIKNNGKYIRHVGGVMLVPGTNQLDKAKAEAFNARIKSNDLDAFLVEKGELVEVQAKNGKNVNSVTDLTVDQAKGLIDETASIETLTGWLADEKRGQNRKAIAEALTTKLAELQSEE